MFFDISGVQARTLEPAGISTKQPVPLFYGVQNKLLNFKEIVLKEGIVNYYCYICIYSIKCSLIYQGFKRGRLNRRGQFQHLVLQSTLLTAHTLGCSRVSRHGPSCRGLQSCHRHVPCRGLIQTEMSRNRDWRGL
jgi:hypothetical protein